MERFDAENFLALIEEFGSPNHVGPPCSPGCSSCPRRFGNATTSSKQPSCRAAPCHASQQGHAGLVGATVIFEYYGEPRPTGTAAARGGVAGQSGPVGKAFFGEIVIRDDDGTNWPPAPGHHLVPGGNSPSNTSTITRRRRGTGCQRHHVPDRDIGTSTEVGYLFITDRQAFVIISRRVESLPAGDREPFDHPSEFRRRGLRGHDEDFGEGAKAASSGRHGRWANRPPPAGCVPSAWNPGQVQMPEVHAPTSSTRSPAAHRQAVQANCATSTGRKWRVRRDSTPRSTKRPQGVARSSTRGAHVEDWEAAGTIVRAFIMAARKMVSWASNSTPSTRPGHRGLPLQR
jgi:hypothetical protein